MLRGRSRQAGPRGRPFVRAKLGHGARLGAVDGFAAIPAWGGGGGGGDVDGWWGFWISDRDIVVVVFSFSWLQNALVKPFPSAGSANGQMGTILLETSSARSHRSPIPRFRHRRT